MSRSFPIPRPLHRARASFSSTACLEPHASRASGYRAGHLSWARFNHRRPYRAYCRGCDISTLEENVTVVIVYVWLVLGWSEKCALTSVSLARIFFVAHFLFCVLSVWQLRRLWGLKGNTLTIMWWVLWSFSTIFHRKKLDYCWDTENFLTVLICYVLRIMRWLLLMDEFFNFHFFLDSLKMTFYFNQYQYLFVTTNVQKK